MNFTPKKLAAAIAMMAAGTVFAAENQVSPSSTSGATAETSQAPAAPSKSKGSATADESVRQLQQSLKDKGFDPGPIDGIMGPKTQAAQQQAQASSSAQPSAATDTSQQAPGSGQPSASSELSSSSSASSSSMPAAKTDTTQQEPSTK